jgi:AraC-like DNA-binding protein
MKTMDIFKHSERDQKISHHRLMQMSGPRSEKFFEIMAPSLDTKATAIRGQFNNVECHSGLQVHATETEEAHDLSVQWRMSPGLTVAIILEGMLDVRLDDRAMQLGDPETPTGQIWNLTQSTLVRRESHKGMRMRKVIISIPPEWIRAVLRDHDLPNANLTAFIGAHLAITRWRPTNYALSLADQILNPPEAPKPIQNMTVESKAIDIVREALSIIIAQTNEDDDRNRRTGTQIRAQRIRRYLQENMDQKPSLQTMSQELGLSIGSMQTAFKGSYKSTIAEYCRGLRLQRARAIIEEEGVSVSEAAYRAGYANPASFSTAFKRRFGLAPSAAGD